MATAVCATQDPPAASPDDAQRAVRFEGQRALEPNAQDVKARHELEYIASLRKNGNAPATP